MRWAVLVTFAVVVVAVMIVGITLAAYYVGSTAFYHSLSTRDDAEFATLALTDRPGIGSHVLSHSHFFNQRKGERGERQAYPDAKYADNISDSGR